MATPAEEAYYDEMPPRAPIKEAPPGETYHAHPQRWPVLAVYAAASFMGALVWNILVRAARVVSSLVAPPQRRALTPVRARVGARVRHSRDALRARPAGHQLARKRTSCGERRAPFPPHSRRSLPQAYYVWCCPGAVLALWVMERYGLRVSLLWGFVLQLVMISLTVTGVHLSEPHVAYAVVWLGQVIGSFGQPLFMNNVVRIPP